MCKYCHSSSPIEDNKMLLLDFGLMNEIMACNYYMHFHHLLLVDKGFQTVLLSENIFCTENKVRSLPGFKTGIF